MVCSSADSTAEETYSEGIPGQNISLRLELCNAIVIVGENPKRSSDRQSFLPVKSEFFVFLVLIMPMINIVVVFFFFLLIAPAPTTIISERYLKKKIKNNNNNEIKPTC